jgi:hypothetical protein
MELCNMVIGVLYIKIGLCLLALPSTARGIVFRFIIEYNSLRDFGPYIVDLVSYKDF